MAKEKKFNAKEEAQSWYDAAEEMMLEDRPQNALNCFMRAANLGHVQAMFEVGETYGADGNLAECLLWTRRAAAFGHEEAIAELQGDGTYVEGWEDDFVARVRSGDYQIEDGITYTADGSAATGSAPEAAAAPAPTTYATAVAAAAPDHGGPGTNATTYLDDVDATMASHLAGITFGGGSSGITS